MHFRQADRAAVADWPRAAMKLVDESVVTVSAVKRVEGGVGQAQSRQALPCSFVEWLDGSPGLSLTTQLEPLRLGHALLAFLGSAFEQLQPRGRME